jgi:hypothetical protein
VTADCSLGYAHNSGPQTYPGTQKNGVIFKGKMRKVVKVVLKQSSLATRINNKGRVVPRLDQQVPDRHPLRSLFVFWGVCVSLGIKPRALHLLKSPPAI